MICEMAVEIIQKGGWYLARAPELDFVSQGETPEEVRLNLQEVIRIQVEEIEHMGTLDDYLVKCGFETAAVAPLLTEALGLLK